MSFLHRIEARRLPGTFLQWLSRKLKKEQPMKRSLPNFLTFLLLVVALSLLSTNAFSQTTDSDTNQDNEVDDSAPVARVARLTLVQGDVSFLRAGVTEWAPVVENLPLLAGDQLYVGRGGRAEVQLARGNYLRLSENTELTIAEFSDSVAQFEITEGTVIIRTERLASVFPRFEVDTPNSAVVLKQDGLYRIDIRGGNSSELIVRNGEAEASTDEGTFRVREGHRLAVDTSADGRVELAADANRDDWDKWNYDRDTTIASTNVALAPDYVTNYETDNNDFYGVSDLSSYGTWTNYSSYGQCWIPRVGSDWAPYRMGQWLWIPSAGWTWLSSEPWGWAPYHYGRWAFLPGLGWAWVPGFGSSYPRYWGHRDYRWRPALVFFFNSPTPRGNYVCWYPLTPGERWHRPDRDRRGGDRSGDHGRRRPGDGDVAVRPPKHRGITILPYDGFARRDRNARPGAPGRDISDAINKGARSGLPEIKPSPVATAPTLGDKASRRVAVPSGEIIKRSVVTRNPNVGSSTKVDVPRERRVILPRTPAVTEGPVLTDRGSDRRANRGTAPKPSTDSQSGSDSTVERKPKLRPSVPTQSENVNTGESGREQKRSRDESSTGASPQKPSSSADAADGEKRKPRHEQVQTPAPRDGSTSGNNNDARVRERKSGEDSAPRTRGDQPARSQEHSSSTQQAQPRQDNPKSENQSQPRSEQHQQKEQPQQQPEQRKKP
jgi:uncharacterized protein DUF6600/FecR-like protein